MTLRTRDGSAPSSTSTPAASMPREITRTMMTERPHAGTAEETRGASRMTKRERSHTGSAQALAIVVVVGFVSIDCAALSSWDGFAGAGDAGLKDKDAGTDEAGASADARPPDPSAK